MKRIALHTLGCKLNYTETASIGKQFVSNGYELVDIDETADVVVINSCSVTNNAERECRQIVRRALRHSPEAFIAVVGCYSQLRPDEIAGIKGVDLVLGSKEKNSIINYIVNYEKKSQADIFVSCIGDVDDFGLASSAGFEDRTRAFIKVQDGCDYNCTYCTIPLARGRSRSTTIENIFNLSKVAIDKGYKEIVLTGVNVGDYGKNEGTSLLLLLKQLVKLDGLSRIRISSVEPNLLTDELLDFWFSNNKICNHWHIPLQSGSDEVLRGMSRRYLTKTFADRIGRINSNIPFAGIGTDIIVGFPTESDGLFQETYEFLNDLQLSYFHIFTYSDRPDTPSAEYLKKNDHKTKAKRNKLLRELNTEKRILFNERFIGKTVPVLFESHHQNGIASGLTEEYIRVDVKSDKSLTNEILNVFIKNASDDRCLGYLPNTNLIESERIAV